tara:strand:+ start:108 stop:416 length:309 start_codon:yes stop_codon:yes gene_type:complete
MIDIDRYEGHLPFTGEERIWVWSKSGMNRMKSVKQFHVTAQLLEDAPALLAEVKRLREGIKRIAKLAVQRNARHTEKDLLELTTNSYIGAARNEDESKQQEE